MSPDHSLSTADSEARRAMKELGFTENECSIYFELLGKPQGEAIETILAWPEMSSGRNEDAIKSLVDKGLVKISSNRLEASEPKHFVSRIQEEKRVELGRQIEAINATTSHLVSILEPRYWEARLGIKPEDLLEPLPTLERMELQTVKILANARREVLISAETFGWFDKVREELGRSIEKRVKYRVLMSLKGKDTTERAGELRRMGIEVRQPAEDWYPVRGTLGDDRELVFLIWTAREGQGEHAKFFRPHFSKNPGMIRIFADAFERRWNAAKKA